MVLLNVSNQVLPLKIAAMCSAEKVGTNLPHSLETNWHVHTNGSAPTLHRSRSNFVVSLKVCTVSFLFTSRCDRVWSTHTGPCSYRTSTVHPRTAQKVISQGRGPTQHEHSRRTVPKYVYVCVCVCVCVCELTYGRRDVIRGGSAFFPLVHVLSSRLLSKNVRLKYTQL